jgi:capsular polysaccharide biosynthesis protein
MQIRALLAVLRRRWFIVALPAAVVAAFALATAQQPGVTYATGMRFTAGQRQPQATPPVGYDPNFFRWQTSEYIVAGLRDWVRSAAFARAVSEELARQGVAIPPDALLGNISADSSQSLLAVYVQWGDRAQTTAIAEAAVAVLQTRNGEAFPQLGGQPAEVVPLDTPDILPVIEERGPSLQSRLQLPFRLALGLATGLALALLTDYFDTTVRGRKDLEDLGLAVLAEIPRGRGKGRASVRPARLDRPRS